MAKPLSDGQQRFFLAVVVVALVAFGIYLAWANFQDDDAPPPAADEDTEEGGAPAPMDVTDEDELDVFDWLPHSEEEFRSAAVTARDFAAAFGTYDHAESNEEYVDRMAELATDDFAETLTQGTGGSALREDLDEEERVSTGRADVLELRSITDEALVFVVDAQSIHESEDGASESLGEFAVTVTPEGGTWRVYDFQLADAGDYGEV
ncbi:hypothetical protein RIF23_18575 [Lipingzhangella sp. LS1_29]|uniref:Mce-associated membrane protein n=1 Tax=Lipingzhangella rawalii TaxID=2055835 RepID=A0ABU2HCK8_9ACTN|nr:hypothetical protein [Lipingzhangella rawalii]MDS1272299.1 hypothetical protein [Lipingzhangella rawalii]